MSPLPLCAPFFALWSTQQGATGLGTSGPWAAAQRASGLRLRDPELRGRRHLGGRTSQPPRPTRRRPRLFTSLAPRRAAAVASTATATTAVSPYATPATNSRTCAGAACRRRCLRSDRCFKKVDLGSSELAPFYYLLRVLQMPGPHSPSTAASPLSAPAPSSPATPWSPARGH